MLPAIPGALQIARVASSNALSASDPTATTIATTYAAGDYPTVDVLPETAGASWSNDGAQNEVENGTRRAAGRRPLHIGRRERPCSRRPAAALPSPTPQTPLISASQNSAGAGSITRPLSFNGTGSATYAFAAPSGGAIAVHYSDSSGNANNYSEPAWFAAPLYAEFDQVVGTVPIPAQCNAPAAAGTSATEVQRQLKRIDAIVGYADQQTIQTYDVLGIGIVCTVATDVNTSYVDWTGGSYYTPYLYNGTTAGVTTTTEVLAITASSAGTLSARRKAGLGGPLAMPSHGLFLRAVAQVRRARQTAFANAFATGASVR